MRRMRILWTVMAVLLLGAAGEAAAKGMVEQVLISGPDWFGELVINDPQLLPDLSPAMLEDMNSRVEFVQGIGRGYLLARGFFHQGEFKVFDRVMYFPRPAPAPGLVYYLEINNGFGPYDGRWFLATEAGDRAMTQILAAQGAAPPALEGRGAAGNAAAGLAISWPLGLLLGILLGLLLGIRWPSRNQAAKSEPGS